MNCFFELVAAEDIQVAAGSYWQTDIVTNGFTLPNSRSREEYHYDDLILADRRIIGFGIKKVSCAEIGHLTFRIATNIFTDQQLLAKSLKLAISEDGTIWDKVSLTNGMVKTSWVDQFFHICLQAT